MSKQINKVSKQDCLQAKEKNRSKEIQEILLKNILWDYISENDIPEISRRLEETEKG